MKALHVNWTKPFFEGRDIRFNLIGSYDPHDVTYELQDFELLTTVLSILYWRCHSGTVKLYTDAFGFSYYERQGLIDLWDEVDTAVLDAVHGVDGGVFWAAGKLYAIRNERAPFVCMDTDLFVCNGIERYFDADLRFCHYEAALRPMYVPRRMLPAPDGYVFDPAWDWSVLPANASLCYFGDEAFKRYYAGEAIRYMEGNGGWTQMSSRFWPIDNHSARMLFAEQRLLAMCAKKAAIRYGPFLNEVFCPVVEKGADGQLKAVGGTWQALAEGPEVLADPIAFHHTWGEKILFTTDRTARANYVGWLVGMLEDHFPAYLHHPGVRRLMERSKHAGGAPDADAPAAGGASSHSLPANGKGEAIPA